MTLTKLNEMLTSSEHVDAEWWAISPDLHQSILVAAHVLKVLWKSTVRYANTQNTKEAASSSEASQPLSDAWIKVGLLSSRLHNNTLDTSSAAAGACGWDYLATRRSLSDLQMDLALFQSKSFWTKVLSLNWVIYLVKRS